MYLLILVMFLSLGISAKGSLDVNLDTESLSRHKRQLLFPNTTLFQLTIGTTVPTPIKTIIANWGFQANFNLPWNRTQIPLDILDANDAITVDSRNLRRDLREHTENNEKTSLEEAKDKRSKIKEANEKSTEIKKAGHDLQSQEASKGYGNDDAKLHHFYKFIEDGVTEGFGDNGSSCVLRMLCDLNQEVLHTDDEEDLLHEIVRFLMNPLNDINNGEDINNNEHSYKYIQAFMNGRQDQHCEDIYPGCKTSLIDLISKTHHEM